MVCQRCAGWMQKQALMDHLNESGEVFIMAWRCLNCGEVLDPVIVRNRTFMPEPIYDKARMRITKGIAVGRGNVRIGSG
ncbi:MAG: hypothetical protein NPIRA02_42110 [Nitrospirales bacterium]|nr:MAG: hypothetical protein NPIRA02_42110 [Nitrospirales bacterium]